MKLMRPSAALLFVGFGCASEIDSLRTRAAFDFQCAESRIMIRNLDEEGHSYGVTGCSQRAVYLYDCDAHAGYDCKWVRND